MGLLVLPGNRRSGWPDPRCYTEVRNALDSGVLIRSTMVIKKDRRKGPMVVEREKDGKLSPHGHPNECELIRAQVGAWTQIHHGSKGRSRIRANEWLAQDHLFSGSSRALRRALSEWRTIHHVGR